MYNSNHFYLRFAETFHKLPDVMGAEELSNIQYFEMSISFFMKAFSVKSWPRAIKLIALQMPALNRFKLVSEFVADSEPLVESSGKERSGQERRALISFGAWLVLRHPNLKLLVWPAESGLTVLGNPYRIKVYIELVDKKIRVSPKSQAEKERLALDDELKDLKVSTLAYSLHIHPTNTIAGYDPQRAPHPPNRLGRPRHKYHRSLRLAEQRRVLRRPWSQPVRRPRLGAS